MARTRVAQGKMDSGVKRSGLAVAGGGRKPEPLQTWWKRRREETLAMAEVL